MKKILFLLPIAIFSLLAISCKEDSSVTIEDNKINVVEATYSHDSKTAKGHIVLELNDGESLLAENIQITGSWLTIEEVDGSTIKYSVSHNTSFESRAAIINVRIGKRSVKHSVIQFAAIFNPNVSDIFYKKGETKFLFSDLIAEADYTTSSKNGYLTFDEVTVKDEFNNDIKVLRVNAVENTGRAYLYDTVIFDIERGGNDQELKIPVSIQGTVGYDEFVGTWKMNYAKLGLGELAPPVEEKNITLVAQPNKTEYLISGLEFDIKAHYNERRNSIEILVGQEVGTFTRNDSVMTVVLSGVAPYIFFLEAVFGMAGPGLEAFFSETDTEMKFSFKSNGTPFDYYGLMGISREHIQGIGFWMYYGAPFDQFTVVDVRPATDKYYYVSLTRPRS